MLNCKAHSLPVYYTLNRIQYFEESVFEYVLLFASHEH